MPLGPLTCALNLSTMPDIPNLPHDLYAKRMFNCGHGLALYEPNTFTNQRSTPYPVQVGDVGWVYNGVFCRLFNVLHESTHPINGRGVPKGFSPLLELRDSIMATTLIPTTMYTGNRTQTGVDASVTGYVRLFYFAHLIIWCPKSASRIIDTLCT